MAVILLMPLAAQEGLWFAGGFVGVSTLSADANSEINGAARLSQYKPENGLTAMGFLGRHLSDYFSVQGSYGWNGNDVGLLAATTGVGSLYVSRGYRSRMDTAMAEGMLYFRNRESGVRPYLSAGAGFTRLRAEAPDGVRAVFADTFSASGVAFRVAVGIDVRMRGGCYLRYSFAETIQGNGISRQLVPKGKRNLANFQNLFGFTREF